MISYDNLLVKLGSVCLTKLQEMKITQGINDHAHIYLTVVIPEELAREIEKVDSDTIVEVSVTGNMARRLFIGKITQMSLNVAHDTYQLRIEGVSSTGELDAAWKNRSFQNMEMFFRDLIRKVISGYSGSDFIMGNELYNKKIERLIIQYQETDWEFLKRVASLFNSGLIPDLTAATPKFWFGFPEENHCNLGHFIPLVRKKIGDYRVSAANFIEGVNEDDFTNYEVEADELFRLGDVVSLEGRDFYICASQAKLIRGIFKSCYTMAPKDGLKQDLILNSNIRRISLEGKVIGLEKDLVKVHLEIDKEQQVREAHGFPCASSYTTEGNTGWYCMPEVDDFVKIYFPTEREEEGFVIGSVRRREDSERTKKPEIKYLRTAYEKEVKFEEQFMNVSGQGAKLMIQLDEKKGVEISSAEGIEIKSKGDLTLGSEAKVAISAKNSLEMKCKASSVKIAGMVELKGTSVEKEQGQSGSRLKLKPENTAPGSKPRRAAPAFKNAMRSLGLGSIAKGVQCANGDPVNAATGNYFTDHEDMVIEGYSPLKISRFYNSGDDWFGLLGRNWHLNYDLRFTIRKDKKAEVTFEDGRVEEFTIVNGDGVDSDATVKQGYVIKNDKGYELFLLDQNQYFFDLSGKLMCINRQNVDFVKLHYQGSQLVRIENNCGCFELEYNKQGLISKVTEPAGGAVEYKYNGGNLVSVRDMEGYLHTFRYDEDNRLVCVVDPLENVLLENMYDAAGRVVFQQMADGSTYSFDYDDNPKDFTTSYTDTDGSQVVYCRDERNRIYERIYPDGVEKLVFDDKDQVTKFTDKNGHTYQYAYNAYGDMIRQIDPLGNVTEFTYDAKHQVVAVKNPDESVYSYKYDENGNMIETEDPLNRRFSLQLNGFGLPVKVNLPDGSAFKNFYDEKGNLISDVDPEGNDTRYEYDDLNRVKRVIQPEGNRTDYEYTASGKVKRMTFPDGSYVTAIYDERGQLIEAIDEAGRTTRYQYNVLGKVAQMLDAAGGKTKYEYDGRGNITKVTKPDGGVVQYKYNVANLLESVIDEDGHTRSYRYDNNGNLVVTTDPNGGVTAFTYDALGRVTKVKDPVDAVTRYEYRFDGKVTKMIDPLNGITHYEYDKAGQMIGIIDPIGLRKSFTYTSLGFVKTVTDAKGAVTEYEYDLNGKITRVIYADGTMEKLAYDRNGNLIRSIDQMGSKTEFEYDRRERLVLIRNAAGGEKRLEYTPVSKLAAIIDENGHRTEYIYDPLDRLSQVIDACGGKTEFVYNPVGNLTEVHRFVGVNQETIDAMKPERGTQYTPELTEIIMKYKYDKRGLLLEESDTEGRVTVYTYDANRNLTSKTDRDGYLIKYAYDAVNNLTNIHYHDGREVAYEYNQLGKAIVMRDWLGETRYDLDVLGRIKKVQDYLGRVTEYSWGHQEEKTAVTYPDGSQVQYVYDIMGRMVQVIDAQNKVTTYHYNLLGNLTEKLLPNGVRSAYSYDLLGRVTRVANYDSDGIMLDEFRYAFDAVGNKISTEAKRDVSGLGRAKEEILGVTKYRYNALDHLVEVHKPNDKKEKYFYDTLGNRVRKEYWSYDDIFSRVTDYTYDLRNCLIGIKGNGEQFAGCQVDGPVVMEYDNRGNLVRVSAKDKILAEYSFDVANKLTLAVNINGLAANYTYDGIDRRVKMEVKLSGVKDAGDQPRQAQLISSFPETVRKTMRRVVNDTKSSLENKVEYDYVTDITTPYNEVLMVYCDDARIKQRYTYGMDVLSVDDCKLSLGDDCSPKSHHMINDQSYFLQNELGSPVRLMDTKGRSRTAYSYEVFGRPLAEETDGSIYSYTGYQYDVATGFMFAQARYYMPEYGRFVSEDILQYGDNWYIYCKNNPLKYIDPTGLEEELPEGIYTYYSSKLDRFIDRNYKDQLTMSVLVTQPKPGSRNCVTGLKVQSTGHTFLRVERWVKDNGGGKTKETFYFGFRPDHRIQDKEVSFTSPSTISNDWSFVQHDRWHVAKVYVISREQSDKALTYAFSYTKDYHSVNNNCTTFAVNMLEHVGIKSPINKHQWEIPLIYKLWVKIKRGDLKQFYGYTPADAGEDIKSDLSGNYLIRTEDNVKAVDALRVHNEIDPKPKVDLDQLPAGQREKIDGYLKRQFELELFGFANMHEYNENISRQNSRGMGPIQYTSNCFGTAAHVVGKAGSTGSFMSTEQALEFIGTLEKTDNPKPGDLVYYPGENKHLAVFLEEQDGDFFIFQQRYDNGPYEITNHKQNSQFGYGSKAEFYKPPKD